MTRTPVIGSFMTQNVNMGIAQVKVQSGGQDFKSFMDRSSDAPSVETTVKTDSVKNEQPVSKKTNDSLKANPEKTDKTTDVSTKVDEKVTEETAEIEDVNGNIQDDMAVETKDVIEEVRDILSEKFGVTKEQIDETLETLGLTMVALLDPNMMPKLVAELTGKEDVIELTTDEDVFAKMMDVSETSEEALTKVAELIEVPKDEIVQAVAQLENISEETEVKEENHFNEAEDDFGKILAASTAAKPQEAENFEDKIEVNIEPDAMRVYSEKSEADDGAKATMNTEAKPTDGVEKVSKGREDSKAFSNDSQTMNFAQTIISKATEILNEGAKAETISYSNFDVENILNQITDSIKANISAETSEINMRLHPETLGSVSVKLTSTNEGVLTATFTAQNEAVKAVIESQAMVLKETLEAKGTTVEAIEVLVQSHEFERDLSNQNRGQSNEETGKGRKTVRRINLSEDIPEDVTDDEAIVREMMAQNGNTIDYSA